MCAESHLAENGGSLACRMVSCYYKDRNGIDAGMTPPRIQSLSSPRIDLTRPDLQSTRNIRPILDLHANAERIADHAEPITNPVRLFDSLT